MSCIGIDVGYDTAGAALPMHRQCAPSWLHTSSMPSVGPCCLSAVVAIARRGGIDVLANEVSKRNTA